jgi:ABC-type hemin transport system substrate-binding protein
MTRLAILSTLFIMLPTGVGATGRVVSTSPEVTELVFQLGGEKSLVGTSQFSDFPPAAKKLPTIGPLFSPGIEKTFRLNPDWIIGDRESANPSFLKTARALNISHTEFALSRPDEILIAAETLSKKLGQNSLPQLFTQAKNCLSKLKAGRKVPFRFIALAWLNPPIIFGSATLLSHFIGLLGGVNAFENSQLRFPQVRPFRHAG